MTNSEGILYEGYATKTDTIINVEDGSKVSYSNALEGNVVEVNINTDGIVNYGYATKSGLWKCKNGDVVAVIPSIIKGERVLATDEHYRNNNYMSVGSGIIKDVLNETDIDLIDSILASGSNNESLFGKYVPTTYKQAHIGTEGNTTVTFTNMGGYFSYIEFKKYKTAPLGTSETMYFTFTEDVDGIYEKRDLSNYVLLGKKNGYFYGLQYFWQGTAMKMCIIKMQEGKEDYEATVVKEILPNYPPYGSGNSHNIYILKDTTNSKYKFYSIDNDGKIYHDESIDYLDFNADGMTHCLGYGYIIPRETSIGNVQTKKVQSSLALQDTNIINAMLMEGMALGDSMALSSEEPMTMALDSADPMTMTLGEGIEPMTIDSVEQTEQPTEEKVSLWSKVVSFFGF